MSADGHIEIEVELNSEKAEKELDSLSNKSLLLHLLSMSPAVQNHIVRKQHLRLPEYPLL